jgi:hypothetical protein
MVDELKDLSQLRANRFRSNTKAGMLNVEVSMPPQSVAAIHFF